MFLKREGSQTPQPAGATDSFYEIAIIIYVYVYVYVVDLQMYARYCALTRRVLPYCGVLGLEWVVAEQYPPKDKNVLA